jgi:hypothetical protein
MLIMYPFAAPKDRRRVGVIPTAGVGEIGEPSPWAAVPGNRSKRPVARFGRQTATLGRVKGFEGLYGTLAAV